MGQDGQRLSFEIDSSDNAAANAGMVSVHRKQGLQSEWLLSQSPREASWDPLESCRVVQNDLE